MEMFTEKELRELLAIVSTRLRYEARRPARKAKDGHDWQQEKVYTLSDLKEKLERTLLAL